MNFKSFTQNSIFSEANYSYSLPKDKELMLYDFYMISHWLNALNYEPGEAYDQYGNVQASATMRMGLKNSTKMSFEHIKEQLLNELKEELLEAAFYSISCEFQHYKDEYDNIQIIKDNFSKSEQDLFKYFNVYFREREHMIDLEKGGDAEFYKDKAERQKKKYGIKIKDADAQKSYAASYEAMKLAMKKVGMSEIEVVELARQIFGREGQKSQQDIDDDIDYNKKYSAHPVALRWGSSFGGRPWYNIANAFIKLYNAKTELQKTTYIDNIYHQQHNSGSVFNKLKSYYKEGGHGGHGWLAKALNFKADNKEPHELIKKIVTINNGRLRNVDRMYIEMLKAAGKQSYNEYFKIIEKVKEKEPAKEVSYDDEKIGKKSDEKIDDVASETPQNILLGTKDDLNVSLSEESPKKFSSYAIARIYAHDVNNDSDKFDKLKKWGEKNLDPSKTKDCVFLGVGGHAPNTLVQQLTKKIKNPLLSSSVKDNLIYISYHAFNTDISDKKQGAGGTLTQELYFVKKDLWNQWFDKNDSPKSEYVTYQDALTFAKKFNTSSDNLIYKYKALKEYGKNNINPNMIKGYVFVGEGLGKLSSGEYDQYAHSIASQLASLSTLTVKDITPNIRLVDSSHFGDSAVENVGLSGAGTDEYTLYFLKETTWDKIFDNIKNKIVAPKSYETLMRLAKKFDNDPDKWNKLKDIGEKDIPQIKDLNVVFIGIGNTSLPLRNKFYNILKNKTTITLRYISQKLYAADSTIFDQIQKDLLKHNNFEGHSETQLYFASKELWDMLFKDNGKDIVSVQDLIKMTEDAKNQPNKWQRLKEIGDKYIPNLQDLVFVGNGSEGTPPLSSEILEYAQHQHISMTGESMPKNLYGVSYYKYDKSGLDTLAGNALGKSPSSFYFLKAQMWNKLFSEKKTAPNDIQLTPREIKKLSTMKQNADNTENIAPILFEKEYVYLGMGQTPGIGVFLNDILEKNDSDLSRVTNTTIDYHNCVVGLNPYDISNPTAYALNNLLAGTLGATYYFMRKEYWDKIIKFFGKTIPDNMPSVNILKTQHATDTQTQIIIDNTLKIINGYKFHDSTRWHLLRNYGIEMFPKWEFTKFIYVGTGYDTPDGHFLKKDIEQVLQTPIDLKGVDIKAYITDNSTASTVYAKSGASPSMAYFLDNATWQQFYTKILTNEQI